MVHRGWRGNLDRFIDRMRANYMLPEVNEHEVVQDPHRLSRCAGHPDVVWCQHHNGTWRSDNLVRTWQEVTGVPVSSFGFAVAAHPGNGDILWFAPAEADQRRIPVATAMALTRTVDGGKIFQVLRDGLPQQPRYDRGYRHDLAVDEDGVSLLMASTSGGLWDSPDAGEILQTVCRTLPPAYAIRFC